MATVSSPLPRITIQFCTQCKWMLRAAYFAQELLSTFNTAIGEIALQPSTGGTFVVEIFYRDRDGDEKEGTAGVNEKKGVEELGGVDEVGVGILKAVVWDRKVEGGFPETKELKRRIRDIIQPDRDLGHVDGHKKKKKTTTTPPEDGGDMKKNEENSERERKKGNEEKIVGVGLGGTDRRIGEVEKVKTNADGSICEDCN